MAKKTKTIQITLKTDSNAFSFFRKTKTKKSDFDFRGLGELRKLLTKEKARMLNIIKNKKPSSIYDLAKILERDFKSVRQDIKLLERFGFIDLVLEKKGKREKHKPVIVVDSINIEIYV